MEIPENGAMTAMPSADISTIGAVTMNAAPSAADSLLAVTAKVWSALRGNKHYGSMRNWPDSYGKHHLQSMEKKSLSHAAANRFPTEIP